MAKVFRINTELKKNVPEAIFRLMTVCKYVLGQWRFLGDDAQEGESKKLYAYMQEPRYIEKVMKQLFSYRPIEEVYDKYNGELIPPAESKKIIRQCIDNVTDQKFSFNKYQNYYRYTVCDMVEFKKHESMDIMVFTRNGDAVLISTSLTSK